MLGCQINGRSNCNDFSIGIELGELKALSIPINNICL